MSRGAARLGRNRRIRKSDDFAAILKAGRRGATRLATVAAVPAQGRGRLGISATTKVGGSVERNRARRLVREYFRRNFVGSAPYDLVVNLKPGFAELTAVEASRVLEEAVTKATSGTRDGRGLRQGN